MGYTLTAALQSRSSICGMMEVVAEGCSLLVAKENQKTTSDFDALEPRKRGCSPLLTPKRRATPEKTEDSRLFGVKIFYRFFRLRRFKTPQSLRDSSPKGEQALARSAALSQKAALQMPFPATPPPVKMGFRKVRRLS